MTDRIEFPHTKPPERTGHDGTNPTRARRREHRRAARRPHRAAIHKQITRHSAFTFQTRRARRPDDGNGLLQPAHGREPLVGRHADAGEDHNRLARPGATRKCEGSGSSLSTLIARKTREVASISSRLSFVAPRPTQVGPIDVRPHLFAGNRAARGPLNGRAALGWNLSGAGFPLAQQGWWDTDHCSQVIDRAPCLKKFTQFHAQQSSAALVVRQALR